jgi:hypothetical protein
MAEERPSANGSPLLRFFGMETGAKAREVAAWCLPYLCLLAAALAGLSYVVQLVNPLPLWVHVVAIVLALVYLFLFLARVRQAGAEARERGGAESDVPED